MDEFSENDIIEILNKLSIYYDRDGFHKNRLSILCPFHSDRNLGSCYINSSSVIHCFSCGASSNLFSLVRHKNPTLSNKQIFDFLGLKTKDRFRAYLNQRSNSKQSNYNHLYDLNFNSLKTIEVDLNLYYCKTREFSKEWIERHNIKIVTEGYYTGYFSIPIYFKNKLVTYEFRKAYEYERLKDLLKIRGSLEDLRKRFKDIKYSLNQNDSIVKYLSKPKTLYPIGVNINDYIFNYDNLDYSKDLYICEGIAGIPSLKQDNSTSIFGSNISSKQIELLNKFIGKKILILDNDEAGLKLLEELVQRIENLYIYPGDISGVQYLLEKSGLFSGIKIC